MVRIEILSGPDSGSVVELGPGTHVVGRQASVSFPLPVDSVSGRHLELQVDAAGNVRFRDLGSTNGTFSAGTKVLEGEWFAGSELRLGNASLKLLDPNASAASAVAEELVDDPYASSDEAAGHARAREAALSGERKGGPVILLLLLLLLGGAGGGYWFFFMQGDEESTDVAGVPSPTGESAGAVDTDWLEGFGQFSEDTAPSWRLAEGITIEGDSLRASAARRAALVRRFAAPAGGLKLSAEVAGGEVRPMIEFGTGEAESGTVWTGAALNAQGVEVAFPEGTEWFELRLAFAETATVRKLTADATEQSASTGDSEGRAFSQSAGNMLLEHSDGTTMLEARATAGQWTAVAGGLDYSGDAARVGLRASGLLTEGPLLIMSEGGPVGVADGVVVDDSPGLLFGGDAGRLLIRFNEPTRVSVREGVTRFQVQSGLQLRWSYTEDLTESSRLARRLTNASRDGNTAEVLAVSKQLMRDYPFKSEDLAEASRLSRAAIQDGRTRLANLAREKADAAFLQSIEDLDALEAKARQYIADYAGTDLAATAQAEAEELAATSEFLRGARAALLAEYRTRLTAALSQTYPLLSTWLKQEGLQ